MAVIGQIKSPPFFSGSVDATAATTAVHHATVVRSRRSRIRTTTTAAHVVGSAHLDATVSATVVDDDALRTTAAATATTDQVRAATADGLVVHGPAASAVQRG